MKKEITAGKGKGRCCDISIYVMPQGSTKEYFKKYSEKEIGNMKRDIASKNK